MQSPGEPESHQSGPPPLRDVGWTSISSALEQRLRDSGIEPIEQVLLGGAARHVAMRDGGALLSLLDVVLHRSMDNDRACEASVSALFSAVAFELDVEQALGGARALASEAGLHGVSAERRRQLTSRARELAATIDEPSEGPYSRAVLSLRHHGELATASLELARSLDALFHEIRVLRWLFNARRVEILDALAKTPALQALAAGGIDLTTSAWTFQDGELIGPQGPLVNALYRTGVLHARAEAMERARSRSHELLVAHASHTHAERELLTAVDEAVAVFYRPPMLSSSASLLRGGGPWATRVRSAFERMHENLRESSPPPVPTLLPRPHPQWLYVPLRRAIYFADLDNASDLILPFHARWLGSDPAGSRAVLETLLPVVVAHEFFHFWRHEAIGEIEESWDEEWLANVLASAYIREFEPEAHRASQAIVRQLTEADDFSLPPRLCAVLDELEQTGTTSQPFIVDGETMDDLIRAQTDLMRRLLLSPIHFHDELDRALAKPASAVIDEGLSTVFGDLDTDRLASFRACVVDLCRATARELCLDTWMQVPVQRVLGRGGANLLDLWAALHQEIDRDVCASMHLAAANYALFCQLNLIDDLQDGDADYVEPVKALLLIPLFDQMIRVLRQRGGFPREHEESCRTSLIRGLHAQGRELDGAIRSAQDFLSVGRGIAGEQFAIYFTVFLQGTRHEASARELGLAMGEAAHIIEDTRSLDSRLFALGRSSVATIWAHARSCLDRMRAEDAPASLCALGSFMEQRLDAACNASRAEQSST